MEVSKSKPSAGQANRAANSKPGDRNVAAGGQNPNRQASATQNVRTEAGARTSSVRPERTEQFFTDDKNKDGFVDSQEASGAHRGVDRVELSDRSTTEVDNRNSEASQTPGTRNPATTGSSTRTHSPYDVDQDGNVERWEMDKIKEGLQSPAGNDVNARVGDALSQLLGGR